MCSVGEREGGRDGTGVLSSIIGLCRKEKLDNEEEINANSSACKQRRT